MELGRRGKRERMGGREGGERCRMEGGGEGETRKKNGRHKGGKS